MEKPARALTIAGSAPRGSAGIQADLKTFQELDVYGMSVVTAVVARHPETNKNIHPLTLEAIEAQFANAIEEVGVDGLKIGMLFSEEVITRVSELLSAEKLHNIVVDPVMVGKLDSKLLADDTVEVLKEKMLPLATLITPNMPEASLLLGGRSLTTVADLKQAAVDLYEICNNYVLVKGGRLNGPAVDVLYDGKTITTFEAPRIDTVNTNGAGCTYSAAIAAYMARGKTIFDAVRLAKSFITTAIEYGFSYTDIVGPTYQAAMRLKGEAHSIKVEQFS